MFKVQRLIIRKNLFVNFLWLPKKFKVHHQAISFIQTKNFDHFLEMTEEDYVEIYL